MTQWIDTHTHLFTKATAGEKPLLLQGKINDVDHYLNGLGTHKPAGTVIVDFSMAKTSDHVLAALEALIKNGVPAKGIIRGNIADARSFDWIKQPHIAGIRLYANKEIPDFSADKQKWDRLFALLRQYRKHICLFGQPALLRHLIRQLPNDLPLLLDHLGMPNAHEGNNQHDYVQLLADLSSRFKSGQPVYFKGPGYRTSFEIGKTVPFILKIIDMFGESQLLLGTSDAPFAGPVMEKYGKFTGLKNQDVIGYDTILNYLNNLIEQTAQRSNKSFEMLQMQLLYSNAKKLYQFDEMVKAAA